MPFFAYLFDQEEVSRIPQNSMISGYFYDRQYE